MDQDDKLTVIIALTVLICLFCLGTWLDVSPMKQNNDLGAVSFIYEQCINESSINVTYSTGCFRIIKEGKLCIITPDGCSTS